VQPPAGAPPAAPAQALLAILSTTDLHGHIRSFDYFKLAEDPAYGFERTATLVRQARTEFANTLLVDNGDTLQGSALADHEALGDPPACAQQHAMYRAMGALGYDAGTLGNHEFNYGLPFLNRVLGGGLEVDGVDAAQRCAGPGFPVVLANVRSTRTGRPLLPPTVLLERSVQAQRADGSPVRLPLRIGVVGFTPPGILQWDRRWLAGKLEVEGAVEAATRTVPALRAQGADIVVALLHGGLNAAPYTPAMENPGLYLARVPGIDALVLGHQHRRFPDPSAQPMPGVDSERGTVHGVPATMASSWGKALGVIRLALRWDGARWQVDQAASSGQLRSTETGKGSHVAADPAIAALVEDRHQATLAAVRRPIGQTDFRMSTLFADVGDPGAIQIVNQAQQAYVAAHVQAHLPAYATLPVLSLSAPFKTGFEGAADYTDVAAGPLAMFNAADLYPYPNTVHAVQVTGADIRHWLEAAARRFNRIDPARTDAQALVANYPGYGFDMFTTPEVQYEIDVTQPVGRRIRNLRYQGRAMDPAQAFVVATNNFRATSGTAFSPRLDGSATLWAAPDGNREVLAAYIRAHPQVTRVANGAARSWRFTPVRTAGPVVFSAPPGALPLARAAGLVNVSLVAQDDGTGRGLAKYAVDLSR
jgi:2',3'-cyclic-nucleotide 2'-phosphodiesterase/3'-nucleotidase